MLTGRLQALPLQDPRTTLKGLVDELDQAQQQAFFREREQGSATGRGFTRTGDTLMSAHFPPFRNADPGRRQQRVMLSSISWATYESLLADLADQS